MLFGMKNRPPYKWPNRLASGSYYLARPRELAQQQLQTINISRDLSPERLPSVVVLYIKCSNVRPPVVKDRCRAGHATAGRHCAAGKRKGTK